LETCEQHLNDIGNALGNAGIVLNAFLADLFRVVKMLLEYPNKSGETLSAFTVLASPNVFTGFVKMKNPRGTAGSQKENRRSHSASCPPRVSPYIRLFLSISPKHLGLY
jgi:hypothetical protein